MQGIVKFYKISKGYGFIAGDDGTDYYFHITDIEDSISETTMVGTRVEFIPFETKRGIMGKKITCIKEEIHKHVKSDICEKRQDYLEQIDKLSNHKQLSSAIFYCTILIFVLSAMNILLYRIVPIYFITNILIVLLSCMVLYLSIKQKRHAN